MLPVILKGVAPLRFERSCENAHCERNMQEIKIKVRFFMAMYVK